MSARATSTVPPPASGENEQTTQVTPPPVRRRRVIRAGGPVDDALLRAGLKLFSEHTVDAVSVDDIVREAAVAKGSFYKHFPHKEALLAAIAGRVRDRMESEVLRANEGVSDPARRVARSICVNLRFVVNEPEQGGVLIRNGRIIEPPASGQRNQTTIDDITAGLAQGRFIVPTVDAGMLFVAGVRFSGLVRFHADQDGVKNMWVAQQLCQLVLRGLGVASPEAELIAAQATEDVLRPRLQPWEQD